jgi:biopolymer transport protein TolQ
VQTGTLNQLFLEVNFWELVRTSGTVTLAVLGILVVFSLSSWTIIFSKWSAFRRARNANLRFLRAFRKSTRLDAVAAATEQFRAAPLVVVFDFGYSEVCRQMAARAMINNKLALERTLQIGMSEEISRLEQSMTWLATIATVSPFIGLFGTVVGIIDAFQQLALSGSTSMRTVAPGIASALITTGVGLFAAIPAAVFYNFFGNAVKEMGARMEDFSLEFLNMTERNFEEPK